VLGIAPAGDEFVVATSSGNVRARAVVIATGYFDATNTLGVPGEDLPHVSHYYREPFEFFRRNVIVVGGRNSGVEAALDLYRHGAHVTVVHRGDSFGKSVKYWIRPDIENRIASGEIAARMSSVISAIDEESATVTSLVTGQSERLPCDALFALIGYRPDTTLLDACGIVYDKQTLVPHYDPTTYETNVRGIFLAGSVACGCRTWEIFIENGREHARSVIEEIDRRLTSGSRAAS
jgi:thioredoxin reductase (NADPH)